MPTALKTKPGINGANVLSIPTEWDATWFRKFINNSLKGADVRNAVGTGGIKVTGNISSPYATIDGSGIVSGITSVVGTANQINVSTVAGVATLSLSSTLVLPGTLSVTGGSTLTAPVVINSTAGQVSLTVNGAAGKYGIVVNGVTGGQSGVQIVGGSAATDILLEVATATNNYLLVWGDGHIELGPNVGAGTSGLVIAATGAVKINAPSSGAALTVTANAASQIGIFNGTLANSYFDYQNAGSLIGRIGSSDSITVGGVATDFAIIAPNGALVFGTVGSTQRLVLGSAGGLILDAPTGGNKGAGTINVSSGYYINGVLSLSTGSFTGTYTGLVGGPTVTCKYTVAGNSVTLFIPSAGVVTSNATSFTLTGLPAAIQPATKKYASSPNNAVNAGSVVNQVSVSVSTSVVTFLNNGSTTGWTATGTKAFGDTVNGATITYDLT